jgi:hypothetical protein
LTVSRCLSMWVVYDHPKDFPDHYVARQWLVRAASVSPTTSVVQSDDLETIREMMLTQMGKHCIGRCYDGDDPKIVEVWI